jgi:hypothetical protein
MNSTRRIRFYAVLALAISIAVVVGFPRLSGPQEAPLAATSIQIPADQFSRYTELWSEPEGFFDSDNFISNETSYLHVMPELQQRVRPGHVYLGVGPDQNFSYIVETKPSLAVIVDIRRQNMLQHFLFKAIFDLSASRGDFLTLLLSREPVNVADSAPLEEILAATRAATTSEELFQQNFQRIRETLLGKFRLNLSADDLSKIEYVFRTFHEKGLDLRFSTIGRLSYLRYPTYQELLLATNRAGERKNFLATDASFQWMKKFEAENRLIPIVGDFAGSGALRAVARFLSQSGLRVSTFYTSNVEFYLFGTPAWDNYVNNVHALPMTDDAVFIRAYFGTYGRPHPLNVPGHRSTSLIHRVQPFLQAWESGNLRTYWDVVRPID